MLSVGGIVLCGGQSRRMGRPKAWLPFGGEFMLARGVRLLAQAVQRIVLAAAPDQAVPPLPAEIAIVRDEEKDRGRLEGLAAGLTALAGKVDAAYLSSCDVPFLLPAFVRRLINLLGEHSICVPKVGDRHHPLAAVYRIDVLDTVRSLLAENCLRPVFLFEKVSTRVVPQTELADADAAMQSLRNLNTLEDYQAAVSEVR